METLLTTIKRYQPLIILVCLSFFGGLALWLGTAGSFMPFFMGLGFLLFSFVKLLNIDDFVNGFQKYDIVAQIIPWYGRAYPVIELCLGLLYLSHFILPVINLITLILMLINTAGVLKSMMSGKQIKCACLGSFIDVPLSTVTLMENIAMGLMAFYMLL